MLDKTLEICKQYNIADDIPIGNLAKSLTDLSNANWNIYFDKEFISVVFELNKRDKILSFVYDRSNLWKVIWFKQQEAKVISGFEPDEKQLTELIKWLEN